MYDSGDDTYGDDVTSGLDCEDCGGAGLGCCVNADIPMQAGPSGMPGRGFTFEIRDPTYPAGTYSGWLKAAEGLGPLSRDMAETLAAKWADRGWETRILPVDPTQAERNADLDATMRAEARDPWALR